MIKTLLSIMAIVAVSLPSFAQQGQSHFEGQLPKKDTSFLGDAVRTQINSGFFSFNTDTSMWGTWTGWSLSSMRDTTNGTFTNDRSSITGGGVNHSAGYAVAYSSPNITMVEATQLTGTYITNTTYAYKVVKNGNGFSKKFGGTSGDDADSFVVRANGYLAGTLVDFSDFYLADYTFSDNKKDYVVNDYKWWDLSTLGKIDSLSFTFYSSDSGTFGLNTPTYFCIDNFNGVAPDTVVSKTSFERFDLGVNGYANGSDGLGGFYSNGAFFHNNYNPQWMSWSGFGLSNHTDVTTTGFANQYSAFAGSGQNKSSNYITANGFGPLTIDLPYNTAGNELKGVYLTNATYTALSMKEGDGFAKKFGGTSGDDEDWYKVDIIGFDADGNVTDTVEFYLADYRFSDNTMDYIVEDWTWVSLEALGNITRIELELSSTDVGDHGMNTPAYVCMDGFNTADPVSIIAPRMSQVQLFPNPAINLVSVSLKQKVSEVEIFNMQGSLVWKGNQAKNIDILALPKGQYTLRAFTANEIYHAPFVKL